MTERRVVRWNHLPKSVTQNWNHIAYEDRWRQCAGCQHWCMLFIGDASDMPMEDESWRLSPVVHVIQMACPVSEYAEKVMCHDCCAIAEHYHIHEKSQTDMQDPIVMWKVYLLRVFMAAFKKVKVTPGNANKVLPRLQALKILTEQFITSDILNEPHV